MERPACFNPRARVGRDNNSSSVLLIRLCFNPRARVGRDASPNGYHIWYTKVSIHAPAWGATLSMVRPLTALSVSIHAPAWGATDWIGYSTYGYNVSIHAPAWGATLQAPLEQMCPDCFNPRARVGRDGPHWARRPGG